MNAQDRVTIIFFVGMVFIVFFSYMQNCPTCEECGIDEISNIHSEFKDNKIYSEDVTTAKDNEKLLIHIDHEKPDCRYIKGFGWTIYVEHPLESYDTEEECLREYSVSITMESYKEINFECDNITCYMTYEYTI